MKLLLINPFFKGVVWAPTLGLGFIGTYIKKNTDWDVEILEPGLENLNENQVLVKAKDADIVGLSCYTESRFECFSFAEKVKQANSDCKIIVGGPHANSLDKLILQYYPFIDGVVRKEGEETMLEIVENKPFKQIKGLTWRNKNEIVRNLDRPLAQDINKYNYDYSLVYDRILKNWRDLEVPYELQKRKHAPIIASRGCHFKCTFCATPQLCEGLWRGVDPKNVVEQMEFLANKYKIGYFRFYDALFTGNFKKTMEFCNILKDRKLDISFRVDIKSGTPKDVLEKLKEVGCEVVGFGIESGSDKILERIRKGTIRDAIIKTVETCKELGYWTVGYFMVSLPDETYNDMNMSFDLFNHFDAYNYQFLKVNPDTEIYQELKQKGEINDEIWFDKKYGNEIFYCKDNFPSANFSKIEMELLIHRMYFDFNAKNPKILFERYGLKKGTVIYPMSLILNNLLKTKIGQKLFYIIKNTQAYDKILSNYRKFYRL